MVERNETKMYKFGVKFENLKFVEQHPKLSDLNHFL